MANNGVNPYAPVVKMGEHLLVWTQNKWKGYTADYIEPMPASSPLVVDFGNVAAAGTIAMAVPQSLRLDENYLMQWWMRPLTDIEIVLWVLAGQAKSRIKNAQARASLLTEFDDPRYLSTEFWVIGKDLDPNIEIRNASGYATDALVSFWGNKYLIRAVEPTLEKLMIDGQRAATKVLAEARVA